tara:strand:- start:2579 stop:3493 length:915 start_codon:yes stop_codon:yes gene_type:complete
VIETEILNDHYKKQLNDNGYFIVENILTNNKDILLNAQQSYLDIKDKVNQGHFPYYRIYDDYSFSKNLAGIELIFNEEILTNPIIKLIQSYRILEIAKEILGNDLELEKSRIHITENFSHVGIWHRDEKINHENESLQINLFLYDETGLQVIRGSHTGEIKESDLIQKTPHTSLENSTWVSTKAGDVLVFNPAILHRGISLHPRANIHFRFRKKKISKYKVNLNYKDLDISKDWLSCLENSPNATDKSSILPHKMKKDLMSNIYRIIRLIIYNFCFYLPLNSKLFYFFNVRPNLKLRKFFNLKI